MAMRGKSWQDPPREGCICCEQPAGRAGASSLLSLAGEVPFRGCVVGRGYARYRVRDPVMAG